MLFKLSFIDNLTNSYPSQELTGMDNRLPLSRLREHSLHSVANLSLYSSSLSSETKPHCMAKAILPINFIPINPCSNSSHVIKVIQYSAIHAI